MLKLPRAENIRGDLQAVLTRNRAIERVRDILARLDGHRSATGPVRCWPPSRTQGGLAELSLVQTIGRGTGARICELPPAQGARPRRLPRPARRSRQGPRSRLGRAPRRALPRPRVEGLALRRDAHGRAREREPAARSTSASRTAGGDWTTSSRGCAARLRRPERSSRRAHRLRTPLDAPARGRQRARVLELCAGTSPRRGRALRRRAGARLAAGAADRVCSPRSASGAPTCRRSSATPDDRVMQASAAALLARSAGRFAAVTDAQVIVAASTSRPDMARQDRRGARPADLTRDPAQATDLRSALTFAARFYYDAFEAFDRSSTRSSSGRRSPRRTRRDPPHQPARMRSAPDEPAGGPRALCGKSINHFGAFFELEWRKHDMLWGRLNAAEILIRSLVPEEHPHSSAADRRGAPQDRRGVRGRARAAGIPRGVLAVVPRLRPAGRARGADGRRARSRRGGHGRGRRRHPERAAGRDRARLDGAALRDATEPGRLERRAPRGEADLPAHDPRAWSGSPRGSRCSCVGDRAGRARLGVRLGVVLLIAVGSCSRSPSPAGCGSRSARSARRSRNASARSSGRRPSLSAVQLGSAHGVRQPRPHRAARLARLPRDDELRPARGAAVGARRGRRGADRPPRDRGRHHVLRHGRRLQRRRVGGDHRPHPRPLAPARGVRARDEGARPHVAGRERARPRPQARARLDRLLAEAARRRLRRPVPDPPLGSTSRRSRRRWRR